MLTTRSKRLLHQFRALGHGRKSRMLAGVPLFVLIFSATPLAKEVPPPEPPKAASVQLLVDELRDALGIPETVEAVIVDANDRMFSVERSPVDRKLFILWIDGSFLDLLEPDELRAAVAHELGHVWIFTHHPYLQTERLANEIGQRVVSRDSFRKVYAKLWFHQGTSGDIAALLGQSEP